MSEALLYPSPPALMVLAGFRAQSKKVAKTENFLILFHAMEQYMTNFAQAKDIRTKNK